jgi:hypothetical protein
MENQTAAVRPAQLRMASHGEPTEFEVVNSAGRSAGPDAVRLIKMPRGTR